MATKEAIGGVHDPLLDDGSCGDDGGRRCPGRLGRWCRKWKSSELRASLQADSGRNQLTMAVFYGVLCGVLSISFSFTLTCVLKLTWETIPKSVLMPLLEKVHDGLGGPEPARLAWVYILVIAIFLGGMNGVSRRLLGYPGDMPHTIAMVHAHGAVPIQEVAPMFFCSLSTVTSGSSLGPEAPLLAICAATVSWISKTVFGHTGRMLRSCTLMGMAAGLSAFFGVSFGGAIFAFEILHTRGIQFFESLSYAVLSSVLCLAVYRGLWALKTFGAVWEFTEVLEVSDSRHIALGLLFGFIGIGLTVLYRKIFEIIKYIFAKLNLVESERPILAGMFGGLLFGIIGVFLPATLFWGEFEMETIADDTVPLNHVWPKGGFWGFDAFMQGNYTMAIWFAIGFAKMVAVAITSVSGLRGGFIFPLMLAGACIGRGLAAIPSIPWWSEGIPASLPAIALAGALTTGITRTPFACALILTVLAGVPAATAPTILACLVVFYGTMSFPFIKAQKDRDDIIFPPVHFPGEDDSDSDQITTRVEIEDKDEKPDIPVIDASVPLKISEDENLGMSYIDAWGEPMKNPQEEKPGIPVIDASVPLGTVEDGSEITGSGSDRASTSNEMGSGEEVVAPFKN